MNRDDVVEALTRQCDNMAFVLNHATLPSQWYDKFTSELEADRAALASLSEAQPEEGMEVGKPRACLWRWKHSDNPNHGWVASQTIPEPKEAGGGCVALEVIPLYEHPPTILTALSRNHDEALGHLGNAVKRLTVQEDEVGDAGQLKINCDKGLSHVECAIRALKGDSK